MQAGHRTIRWSDRTIETPIANARLVRSDLTSVADGGGLRCTKARVQITRVDHRGETARSRLDPDRELARQEHPGSALAGPPTPITSDSSG